MLRLSLLLLVTACAPPQPPVSETPPTIVTEMVGYTTERLLAPTEEATALSSCFDDHGVGLKVHDGELLRLRIFNKTIESKETEVAASSVKALCEAIPAFLQSNATTATLRKDSAHTGHFTLAITSGGPIYNMTVESKSNAPLSVQLRSSLFWPDSLYATHTSVGKLLQMATSSTRLIDIVDSSGSLGGVEVRDTLLFSGVMNGVPFVTAKMGVTDTTTLAGVIILLNAAIGGSASISQGALKIAVSKGAETTLRLETKNYSSTAVLPDNFNRSVVLRPEYSH